jgi:hypothetical protein
MTNEHRNDGSWRTLAPKKNREFKFTPQDNISPLESAWLVGFLMWWNSDGNTATSVDDFHQWPLIKRHFTEVK